MKWVRPIISVAFSGSLIYGFVVGKISTELFVPVAGVVILWWYKDRQADKVAASQTTTATTVTTTPPTTPPNTIPIGGQ